MSDLDLMGSFGLDSSGGIGELDNIANSLGNIDAAAASAGSSISDSMNQAASSFETLSNTANSAYSSIESGAAKASGAASNLGSAAKEAGAGAQEAAGGFSILDGITLGAGIAAVNVMTAAAQELLQIATETVAMYGELEAAATSAAMRSDTATTTADYVAASQEIQERALAIAPKLGESAKDVAGILSTYKGTEEGLVSMESLADATGTRIQDTYSSLKLIGKQFGEEDYIKNADVAAKAYAKTGFRLEDMGRAGTLLSGSMGMEETLATVGTLQQKTGLGATQIAMAIANAEAQLAKSSSEIETKVSEKGKVTSKPKYEGMGKEFADMGMDVNAAKAQGLEKTLVQMYQKGIDFSTIFSGKQASILEAWASQQGAIQGLTTELGNSQGAAVEMGNAVDQTLDEMTQTAENAVETAKTSLGSLFEDPAKQWQGAVTEMANAFTGFVDRIKTVGLGEAINELINSVIVDASGVGGDIIDSMRTGITAGASKIATGIYDTLKAIDYEQVGWALYGVLDNAWTWAGKKLEGLITMDFSAIATGIINSLVAIGDVIDPVMRKTALSMEEIFLDAADVVGKAYTTLGNAVIDTLNAIGPGIVEFKNEMGNGIVGAIRLAISAFADFAGAADEALGGALSGALGLTGALTGSGGVSGLSGNSALIQPSGRDTNEQFEAESNTQGRLFFPSRESAVAYIKANPNEFSAYDASVGISSSMGGGSWNRAPSTASGWVGRAQVGASWDPVKDLLFGGGAGQQQEQAEPSTPVAPGAIYDSTTGLVFGDEGISTPTSTTVAQGQANVGTALQTGSVPTTVEDTQAITAAHADSDEIVGAVNTFSDAAKADAKLNGNVFHDEIEKWSENTLKREDDQWTKIEYLVWEPTDRSAHNAAVLKFEQAKLDALEKAETSLEELGGDNKDALADVRSEIADTKKDIGTSIAAAATKETDTMERLFYRDYQERGYYEGPTKDYPAAMAETWQDIAKSALVNAQNPQIAVGGSMTGYTSYARGKLQEAGLYDERGPVYPQIDQYIKELKTAKEDLEKPATATIDNTEANAKLDETKAKVDEIQTSAGSIKITVDTEGCAEAINTLTIPENYGMPSGPVGMRPIDSTRAGPNAVQPLSAMSGGGEGTQTRYLQDISSTLRTQFATLNATERQTLTQTLAGVNAIRTGTSAITGGISSAASSINATITSAANMIVNALGNEGGGGGRGTGDQFSNVGGGASSWATSAWTSTSSFSAFAEGGFVSKPTIAMIGDSPGGEYLVPAQAMNNLVSAIEMITYGNYSIGVGLSIDTSQVAAQLRSISVPPIRVPIVLEADSNEIRELLTSVLYEVLADTRI